MGRGQAGDGVEVGGLDLLAPPVVDDQALGDVREQRARLAAPLCALRGHDAHEGVVRQVGRVERIAEPAAQPRLQPAVVVDVQAFDALLAQRVFVVRHETPPTAARLL